MDLHICNVQYSQRANYKKVFLVDSIKVKITIVAVKLYFLFDI